MITSKRAQGDHGYGVILCSAERDSRSWWKNLRGGADVTLVIRGQEVSGRTAAIVDDREAIAEGFDRILTMVPRDAKYYDVRLNVEKRPLPKAIARAAQRRVIIQIQL